MVSMDVNNVNNEIIGGQTMKRYLLLILFSVSLVLVGTNAFAAPVEVNYSLSGSPGNWTYNFSVTNNAGVNNLDLYFWGVNLPSATITGGLPNWSYSGPYDGANLTWLDYGVSLIDMIHNGETKSGFLVSDTSLVAPTAVPWMAYLYDWNYTGATYGGLTNPSFYGTASAVPLPSTLLLLYPGLAGLAVVRGRFKKLVARAG
jgi:hypothetical protein